MKSGVGDLKLQVGIKDSSDSKITLSSTLFDAADSATLLGVAKETFATSATTTATAASQLSVIDSALTNITNRSISIGAAQNKLESALDSLTVQSNNLTSSLSTIRDADISDVSSRYIQAQILQQASATLLATANQSPSVALSLI